MLTRFVRIQLTTFALASVVAMAFMFFQYKQVPTLLGIGKLTVTLELPDTGGLYRFSNVTYRGVQIGKVTAVGPTAAGAKPHCSLILRRRSPPMCMRRCVACPRWASSTWIWCRARKRDRICATGR